MADKKLRPAADVVEDLLQCELDHSSGLQFLGLSKMAEIIDADRAAVRADERAKVVREITEWIRGNCMGIRVRHTVPVGLNATLATEIEERFGGKTNG